MLVMKPDEAYCVDSELCVLDIESCCQPGFGALDGAGKIGVPGPTLGIPQAFPPGYTVIGMTVVLLLPSVMMLDVVSVEVKLTNEL